MQVISHGFCLGSPYAFTAEEMPPCVFPSHCIAIKHRDATKPGLHKAINVK
jgi:hypothetical protein